MGSSARHERLPAHANHPATASRRLLGAVLERAMRDAVGPLGTGSTACTPNEQQRARAWFQDASVEPMSFRWLCLVLDLDPGAVARRLEFEHTRPLEHVRPSDPVEPDALLADG